MRAHFSSLNDKDGQVFSGSDPCEPNPKLVGNKASNLWRLSRIGLCVPKWFVISHNVFSDLMEQHCIDVKKLFEINDIGRIKTLFSEKLLSSGRQTLKDLIQKQLQNDLNHICLFSVRSSAIDEDSKNTSFAGMMDSYLFVPREDLVQKVAQCAASALSERAILYRKACGIPLFPLRIAVIIQEMIDSKKSGVLFTRDPISSTSNHVITVGYGVGEGVVSGAVETDTYWIDAKTGGIVRSQIDIKKSKMSMSENVHKGTAVTSIKASNKPILTSDEIQILLSMIKIVISNFDEPQDVEWAFEASGRLYLLQSRPITSKKRKSEDLIVWDNSNIVESYPGVTTPLTYSFVRSVYENVMKRTVIRLTLNRKTVDKCSSIFETLIGYIDGRIYYNLTNWYGMVSFIPALAKDKTACNRMLGIDNASEVIVPSIPISYISYVSLFWRFVFKGYYRRHFYRRFGKFYEEYAKTDFNAYSPSELYVIFKKLEAALFSIWPITIENDIFLIFSYEILNRLLNKTDLADQKKNHINYLLSQPGDMESLKPVQSVLNICKMIQSRSNLKALFSLDDERILRILSEDVEYKDVYDTFLNHIQKYGDRTLHELKLETRSMRDDPTFLIRVIRRTLSCEKNLNVKTNGFMSNHFNEAESLLVNIKSKTWRFVFRCLVKIIGESITHRENMRFARSRAYGLVKRIFLSIGWSYHRMNILEQPDDIFFLDLNEIFAVIKGSATDLDLKHTVRIRKERYSRQVQSPTPPSRVAIRGMKIEAFLDSYVFETDIGKKNDTNLCGIACSPGQASGQAKIVKKPDPDIKMDGNILISEMTDPGWVFLMMRANGLIVERGSVLSHTAIIGRELGIPTIVGVKNATKRIPDGSTLYMNGETGEIHWQ